MTALALTLALAAALVPLIHRDLRRAVARRRTREIRAALERRGAAMRRLARDLAFVSGWTFEQAYAALEAAMETTPLGLNGINNHEGDHE